MKNIDAKKVLIAVGTATLAAITADVILTWWRKRRAEKQAGE